jgi:predicted transcriptional regulator
MAKRPAIHPYLPDDLYDRFKKYAAATGATESSLVEAALREFLDPARDRKLLNLRLDRIARSLEERVEKDLLILRQALSAFVELWLTHTPEIPEGAMERARASAKRRFYDFAGMVERRLTAGSTAPLIQERVLPSPEYDPGE